LAGTQPAHQRVEGGALSLEAMRQDHAASSEIYLVLGNIAPNLAIREN